MKQGKRHKNYMICCLVTAALVLAAGILAEFFCNLPAIRANSQGGSQPSAIPLSQISSEGFEEENGALVLKESSGRIRIPLNGRYVDKLCYSYDYEGLLNLTARFGTYNAYGEQRESEAQTVDDRNSRVLNRSYIKIGKRAEYVELLITREGLREPGLSYLDFDSYRLAFTGFEALTVPTFNWYRVCFFWCVLGLSSFLFWGREYLGKRVEAGFLAIALSVGTLMSLSLPANKVSWDEEIHFSQSLWLANYLHPVQLSTPITQMFITGIDTWPYNQPGTLEEQRALDQYLDENGDYRNGEHTWSADLNKTIFTGYAGQALFLKAGEILHLPFSALYKLGRLGNLLIYCLVLFFAIRKTPVGKGIMAFLGLMPAPVMMAGVYSYDPTVIAFLYLAFAYLLWAILEPEKKITWKEYAILAISFFWGCRVKAIYAPLLLIGLLIPSGRFRNKKEEHWMKAGLILVFLILMASFILPVLVAPSQTGDVRGTDTSEIGQMAYVLGQPLVYAKVLIENIWKTLPAYVIGESALGIMGHQGAVPFGWLIYAGSVFVILTNGQSSCGKRLGRKQRLWIFILSAASVIFVWTSMYIVFTTPGNTYIEGVQGRYYIPVLFLVWLILNPGWITVHLKNSSYYPMVLGLGGGILLAAYFTNVLTKFCL